MLSKETQDSEIQNHKELTINFAKIDKNYNLNLFFVVKIFFYLIFFSVEKKYT